ncbi:Quercetin 2,3-dioxygenase [Methylobacterium mesophilicum]|uniref:cupin domain-containing protein n=1 Tax=Methylobacterium mesophilicum TaxID=39956 RepID=UPI001EE2277B|nr:cupin domain-containing protein [Methylobacterium mesophilicum]GJE21865.1 Quercetin 2,3-dioxygenase [Methylobacterium mesophilicum]
MADTLWFTTARLTIHLSQKDNADGLTLIEHHMAEGFSVPLHVHRDEDESFYILQGEVRMQIEHEVRRLTLGDALTVSGGTPHSLRVVSSEARFLSMTTGRFEGMIRSLARPAKNEGLPPQAEPTAEEVAALIAVCAAHGIEFPEPAVA